MEKIHNLLRRLPLTFKMITVCLIIGIIVWYTLDRYHTKKVRMIFIQKLKDELSRQAEEDRLRLDHYIKLHNQSVKMVTMFKGMMEYVESRNWSEGDQIKMARYNFTPSWFPPRSVLRILAHPRYALLLDRWTRVREVYLPFGGDIPNGLMHLPTLTLQKSMGQSYMTTIDGKPFLLASSPVYRRGYETGAILMFATPIDNEFLMGSIGTIRSDHVTALLSPGKPPTILTSSNLFDVPPGVTVQWVKKRYMLMGKAFFDYGSSDLMISLVSLLSLKEVERLTKEVVSRERQAIAGVAIAFIITFTSLMLFITHRIRLLTYRISEFSEKTLGMPREKMNKGDKLYILEERFRHLTEEVIAAREEIKRAVKKQAEEKTRVIVESAFDAIVTINSEGVITTWNPQSEKMFGWKRDEAMGREVAELLIPDEFSEAHKRGLRNFLLTGKGRLLNQQIEIYAKNRRGETFPVELTVSHAKTDEGDVFIAVIRDITERKEAEKQIRASLHEKEILLREIHHRVKNNMQVISSLLRLQAGKIKDHDEMELLNESQNRIKSMALVHEKLYNSRDLARIDFNDYIRDLARGLYRAYGVNTEGVRLRIDASEIWLGVDTAIPCGLIVNELISNALKYAFPEGRNGEIYVGLRKIVDLKNGEDPRSTNPQSAIIELTVKDNGIGLPEGIDIRRTESLGLRLVTTLTENQLKGTIELNRGGGTEFKIRFKEIRYEKRL